MLNRKELIKAQLNKLAYFKSNILINIEDEIEKAEVMPVGYKKQYKDGWYEKGEDGRMHKMKPQPGATTTPKEEDIKTTEKKEEPIKETSSKKEEPTKETSNKEETPKKASPIMQKIITKVQNIVKDKEKPLVEKITSLNKMGFSDEEALVALTQAPLSEIIKMKQSEGFKETVKPETQQTILKNIDEEDFPNLTQEDVWSSYEMFIDLVAMGERKGLLAYGTGGVGKTYTLKKVLNSIEGPEGEKLIEYDEELDPSPDEYDYIKITGKATPVSVYQTLFEHNDKIIVFDDCDSVLRDQTSLNLLKGAMDTNGDGVIDYKSASNLKDSKGNSIPKRFNFTGQVIFISNMESKRMIEDKDLAALKSRCLAADLTMDLDQTIDKLDSIKYKMDFYNAKGEILDVSKEDREAAVDFIKKYKTKIDISKVNARVLGSIALIKRMVDKNPDRYNGLTWEAAAAKTLKD